MSIFDKTERPDFEVYHARGAVAGTFFRYALPRARKVAQFVVFSAFDEKLSTFFDTLVHWTKVPEYVRAHPETRVAAVIWAGDIYANDHGGRSFADIRWTVDHDGNPVEYTITVGPRPGDPVLRWKTAPLDA